ncbi:hypothetical protein D3C76_201370 [compost metagenome]
MFVTLGVVGEYAGGVHIELDLAVFRLGGVKAELAVDILESTRDEAVAQVADLEVDKGVLAFLVDHVISGHYLTCGQQSRTDCQCGERLFQHAFYSFGVEVEHQALRPSIRARVASRSIKWCFKAARAWMPAKITSAHAR